MQPARKTVIQEYQQKVAEMNNRMRERGLQLFQEKFLDQKFEGEPSYNWMSASQRALDFLAPKTLQVSREVYFRVKSYSTCERGFSLTNEEFALLGNAQEHAGPAILERFAEEDFSQHLDESEKLIALYQENLQAARKEIDQIIQEEFMEEHKSLEAEFKSPQN